jgi:hypothetical protein
MNYILSWKKWLMRITWGSFKSYCPQNPVVIKQMSLPSSFITYWTVHQYLLTWSSYLISTDPIPVLSLDFPCGPTLFSSLCSYIAGCFRLVAQSAATCSRCLPARGFFYPEDGDDTFLWNVGSHKIYMAPHPRIRHSSNYIQTEICVGNCFLTHTVEAYV